MAMCRIFKYLRRVIDERSSSGMKVARKHAAYVNGAKVAENRHDFACWRSPK